MNSKNTLSDEIRRLEGLREEGFLGEKQFLREVRELTKRFEHQNLDEGEAPEPADLAAHSVPVEFDPGDAALPETPHLTLEDDGPEDRGGPDPEDGEDQADRTDDAQGPAPRGDGSGLKFQLAEQARVIVRGKSPYDDRDDQRVSLQAPREEKKGAEEVFDKKKKAKEIRDRALVARMAEKTNRVQRRKKNPDTALLLSLLWPGLGNLYIGQVGTGVLFMLVGGGSWIAVVGYGVWEMLFVAVPLGLLTGAVARKKADLRNRSIDSLRDSKLRMQPKVSKLNVDKSLRTAPPPDNPKGR